jgi:hypothetical protein
MITRRAVLILGAGASMPFGFPSGAGLMTEVIQRLSDTKDPMGSLIHKIGFRPEQINHFLNALKKSGKRSVDAFLEHRIEFLEIGKVATACILLPYEREDSIFERNESNWYEYLFNKLNARFEEFDKNSVSVLTFNYDRSLEQYLLTALQNSYGKTTGECAEKLHSVPIIHLYGQLGGLPSLSGEGLEFGAPLNPEVVRKAADGIQIIHEDVAKNPNFQRAHELLGTAERVCFLGFGYDQTNLERLSHYKSPSGQLVIGSAKGFTNRERQLIGQNLAKFGFPAPNTNIAALQNLGFTISSGGLDSIFGDVSAFLHTHCPLD